MSPFDPKKRSTPRTLTTESGVTVIVKPAPPPDPKREPEAEAPERFPAVVVRPPARPAHEGKRDAFVRRLHEEHGKFIRDTCRAEGDINEESTKDLAQRVLEIAGEQFDKHAFDEHGPPKNLRGWLTTIARNEASNHRRVWRPKAKQGADADAELSPAPDPEGTAQLAERRAKLERYLIDLPKAQAEVVRCFDLYELTIEQTAEAVGCSVGTAASRLTRGRKRLEELAHESTRATDAGERRR